MKNLDINSFTSKMTSRPEVGDIIFGEPEFVRGRIKDDIIEVGVSEKDCIKEGYRTEKIFSKNKYVEFPVKTETDISSIDETRKSSTWIVEKVKYLEELPLLHSVLPESYYIRARRMNGNQIDPSGEVIEFYTCGSTQMFKNIIDKKLEVIGHIND